MQSWVYIWYRQCRVRYISGEDNVIRYISGEDNAVRYISGEDNAELGIYLVKTM